MTRPALLAGLASLPAIAALAAFAVFAPAASATEIVVHKNPACGCCDRWVEHLEENGFSTRVVEHEDMTPVKAEAGVPQALHSCHTAMVDGYVIEGHVPAADIARLLEEGPEAIGLAVPGMPAGSPGMEHPVYTQDYDVILFDGDGRTVFSEHR
ncbi:metal-binding protein [Marinicauda salina]|uniref:Metal-binding protein n=1 Tax=Marinicauda salina TaxID=2135793 RepID=A0A2U2BVR2_9PROT|nr:DUF411 domain-containing protein [Marinicauda salina]PWE18069.1 metal-binding protein [Marinicauda salina]